MEALNKNLPRFAAATTAIIFGFSFIFTKNALDYLDTFQLIGLRFLMAAIILTLFRISGLLKINIHRSNIKVLLLVALFQPVLYFICETFGVDLTSASESGIVISLAPIAITIFAVIMLKERLVWFQWVSVFVSVIGVIIIIIPGSSAHSSKNLLGVVFLLGAVVSAGLYNVFSRRVSSTYTPVEITYIMMWVGAFSFNIIGIINAAAYGKLASYFKVLTNTSVLVDILYLGILSSVVAFFLLNYSLSKLEASVVAVFMNLTPIISVLAGVFIRGETFYLYQCIGGLIVLLGLWGVNLKQKTNSLGETLV